MRKDPTRRPSPLLGDVGLTNNTPVCSNARTQPRPPLFHRDVGHFFVLDEGIGEGETRGDPRSGRPK
jgi:hypothetical protein